jgi:hypothetical protein
VCQVHDHMCLRMRNRGSTMIWLHVFLVSAGGDMHFAFL